MRRIFNKKIYISAATVLLAALILTGSICMNIKASEDSKDIAKISAIDSLDRKIPEITGYREDRYVGLFYFIWFNSSSEKALDVTKLLRTNPEELWDPRDKTGIAPPLAMYYFNEPLYGYYSSRDPWVVKKHIELFIYAGIDFIALDVSNAEIYIDSLTLLLDTLEAYRKEGFKVPQVVFYTNLDSGKTVKLLYNLFYKKNLYKELWFFGPYDKPLMVGHIDEIDDETIKDFFHFRPAQWPGFEYPVYEDGFPFCDLNRPQRIHQDLINVSVAQHTSYIFSFGVKVDPKITPRDINHGRGYTSASNKNGDVKAILSGANIQEQWDYAISKDPAIIFVTGWNEWATNKRAPESDDQTVAWFVDSFNTEYSRDIEMTKSPGYAVDENGNYLEEGYGDNYYLQMIQNIRRYKGIKGSGSASSEKTISISDDFTRWQTVENVYRNVSIDNEARNFGDYKVPAAENFLKEIRVCHDKDNLYFYIKADAAISEHKEGKTNWMNLFIGVEGSKKDKWTNYNFVVNRNPVSSTKTSLEEYKGESFVKVSEVDYIVKGNEMQITIPQSLLGIKKGSFKILFKCADSVEKESDIMDYYVSGDTMPIGRLSYTYSGKGNGGGNVSYLKWVLTILLIVLLCIISALIFSGCSKTGKESEGNLTDSLTVPRVKEQKVKKINGEYDYLSFDNEVKVYIDSGEANVALSSLKIFLPDIEFTEGSKKDSLIIFRFDKKLSDKAEYYEIKIDDKITISYTDKLGARNAVSTIANMLEKSEGKYMLPKGSIKDYPDFSHRSALLECSGRVWMSIEDIKEHLTRMALSKMNYLHFHFMEYKGCSIALDNLPKLAGYGGSNKKYSKDEIRELIKYAEAIGIEIVPGVEMPAHAQALLASYPALRCKTEAGIKTSSWVTCAGTEDTFQVYEAILTEVAELFPGKYIHIGADELDFGEGSGWEPAWMNCSKCKELCDQKGFSTEREIYYYVINRIHGMTTELNRQIIMFNDQIDISKTPDIPKDIIIQFWRIATPGRGPVEGCSFERFLEEGFKVINSYYPEAYVDFEEYATSDSINKWTPLTSPKSDSKYEKQIIGGEFCAWEEHSHFEYTIPSATLLYADRLWNKSIVSYDDSYGIRMTRTILGINTPDGFNIFRYLGDVFPPRDDVNKAYLDKVEASIDELNNAKNILLDLVSKDGYGIEAAKAYTKCIDWIIEKRNR